MQPSFHAIKIFIAIKIFFPGNILSLIVSNDTFVQGEMKIVTYRSLEGKGAWKVQNEMNIHHSLAPIGDTYWGWEGSKRKKNANWIRVDCGARDTFRPWRKSTFP